MFVDRFTQKVVQPDESLVKQFHRLLDVVSRTDENLAFVIDLVVADLLKFRNPNQQSHMTPPEILLEREDK